MSDINKKRFNVVMQNDGDGHFDPMECYRNDGEYVFFSDYKEAVDEIRQHQRLAWLASQDWVFWSNYNGKAYDDDAHPAICTNDVFAPAADAYGISLDQADELYEIGRDKGYEGIIDWIIARESWQRWREHPSSPNPAADKQHQSHWLNKDGDLVMESYSTDVDERECTGECTCADSRREHRTWGECALEDERDTSGHVRCADSEQEKNQ